MPVMHLIKTHILILGPTLTLRMQNIILEANENLLKAATDSMDKIFGRTA